MLGPGGGTGSGFSGWKAKPASTEASAMSTSASFSSSSVSSTSYPTSNNSSQQPLLSYTNKTQQSSSSVDDYSAVTGVTNERRSTSYAQSPGIKLNKQHSNEMTARLSMDSNKGLNRSVQNVKKMESYTNLPKSENSSQASSRETSLSRPSDSRENSRTRNSDTASKSA
jgi:hypothetical protein